ncbi:unnamed protein product [Rotaria sp. Silwood2]|nr:unnamed protein product [Rotaria sp. Silwood2]CAF2555936.1 unnamed protein product [Rotaria sp. Silwood2]CAF2979530.1 unnamed protein product [Rotaria sp. Silwood2]CAF3866878.1 unnamed protein product [Rotaria sp. Silwood2]CAF4011719.1 unnamed protein product [Rotaria sp. Silwood2]
MITNSPPHVNIVPTSSRRFYLKAIVYIFVIIFGLGTWTNLAGLWVELPIIVPILPESWQLPAKLTLIINAANIFPILIVFASIIFKLNTASFEIPVNFILLVISITLAIAFAFLWDKTAYLFGTEQSVCLMSLCFFTAVADCMSSTTFIPFLHRYEPLYLNAYFTGEALTALLPALLGISQGIGTSDCIMPDNKTNETLIEVQHPPRFSVRTYFLLLSSLPLAALLAFSSLHLMKTGRIEKKPSIIKSKHHQSRIFILMDNIEDIAMIQNTIKTINKIENQLEAKKKKNQLKGFATSEQGIFLFIVFQSSAILYGICPGLTTFSLNAYSATTFHYTIIANSFAYPIMTLIGAFIPEVSSKSIGFLYTIHTIFFVYIFLTAKFSPCPPLVNSLLGHVIIFFVWLLIFLTGSYIRILMGNYFRKKQDQRGLVWFGLATQIGAFVGSFIIFILTNSFELFKERNICDKTSQCF